MSEAAELLGRVRAHTAHVHQVLEQLSAARHPVDDPEHGITAQTDGWGLIDRIRLTPAALTVEPQRLGEAIVAAVDRAAQQADRHREELCAPLFGAAGEDHGT